MKRSLLLFFLLLALFRTGISFCADTSNPSSARPVVGEIFGKPVTDETLTFATKTVSLFSAGERPSSGMPDRRAEAWRHLTLLGEAEQRGLTVSEAEMKAELERLLKEKRVTYGSLQYFEWVEKTIGEPAETFERRIEDMLKVQKLLSQLVAAPGPDGKPGGGAGAQAQLQAIVARANIREFAAEKVLEVETSQGSFEMTLDARIAPKAVENMVRLAEKGYFDGILFHRVDPTFVIQGGDPTGTGAGGKSIWGEEFEDEFHPDVRFDRKGIVAMANHGPDTNTSQFFITLRATPELQGRHTLFGYVSSGMETIDKIAKVPTDHEERPLTPVKILKIRLKK